jgi:hypothetical protein
MAAIMRVMNASFQRHLALRLVRIAWLASPIAASSSVGCSTQSVPHECPPFQVCVALSELDAGDTLQLDAGITLDLDGSPPPVDASATSDAGATAEVCPPYVEVKDQLESGPASFESGPVKQGSQCCYVFQPWCI